MEDEKPNYDHIRYNWGSRRFVLPPQKANISGFDPDAVKDIALEKIAELEVRLDELIEASSALKRSLDIKVDLDFLI